MQQVRCDLCGRLVAVEANQPGTCPSCGFALHIPAPAAITTGADDAPILAHAANISATTVAPDSLPDFPPLTLGPFVADPAPLTPPPPLPAPPAPEVAAGTPVVPAFIAPDSLLEGAAEAATADAGEGEPYADMVVLPTWEAPTEVSSPPMPLMPPVDAPAMELLPAPFPPAAPPLEASAVEPAFDTGIPGTLTAEVASETTVVRAGPLMPQAEPVPAYAEPPSAFAPASGESAESTEQAAPVDEVIAASTTTAPYMMEIEPPTQTAEPEVVAPAPAQEPEVVAPAATPPTSAATPPEPVAAFMPPGVPPTATPIATPMTAPAPPAGYPQYPQYPSQPGMPPFAQMPP
ncbi:MAG: hypothetical protein ACRDHP_01505, partial [Ktedonobacterales bacterium]